MDVKHREQEMVIDWKRCRLGVPWADLDGPRPGIDREAWLNEFMSGIGGAMRGVDKWLWA